MAETKYVAKLNIKGEDYVIQDDELTTKVNGLHLDMSINPETYVITLDLKDNNNTQLGTTQTIDLPLESVVVNGRYDSPTKTIILTLDNGTEVTIPIGDVISTETSERKAADNNLQTQITSNKSAIDTLNGTGEGSVYKTVTDEIKDGTLLIQQNSINIGTFSANSSTNALINIITPTKTSDLNNDSGFITKAVDDLSYYYTKDVIDTMIAPNLRFEVVQSLPTQDISGTTIYLVPNSSSEATNTYDEYVYISTVATPHWEVIGSTNIDLSSYIKTEYNAADDKYYTNIPSNTTVRGEVIAQDFVIANPNYGTVTSVASKLSDLEATDDTKVSKSGDSMSGTLTFTTNNAINYKIGNANTPMIRFKAGNQDGQGIIIGGYGLTVIGSGESISALSDTVEGITERMIVSSDQNIEFYTNCQDGLDSAKHITINTDGTITADGFNGTADKANKIVPKYTSKELTTVSAATNKYIKLADCSWTQTGTLQVYLSGVDFEDTLIINFGGGNARNPMLCGYYTSNSNSVHYVIAERGSKFDDNYSIGIKITQINLCTVNVAILNGDCTINISETTTAPTNISEWVINRGIFGTFYGNLTGNVTGNSDTATKAIQDASGNVITSTYATKTELNKIGTKLSKRSASDVYAWAKASTKPSYTASEVGAQSATALTASKTHTGSSCSVTCYKYGRVVTAHIKLYGNNTIYIDSIYRPASTVYFFMLNSDSSSTDIFSDRNTFIGSIETNGLVQGKYPRNSSYNYYGTATYITAS